MKLVDDGVQPSGMGGESRLQGWNCERTGKSKVVRRRGGSREGSTRKRWWPGRQRLMPVGDVTTSV